MPNRLSIVRLVLFFIFVLQVTCLSMNVLIVSVLEAVLCQLTLLELHYFEVNGNLLST